MKRLAELNVPKRHKRRKLHKRRRRRRRRHRHAHVDDKACHWLDDFAHPSR